MMSSGYNRQWNEKRVSFRCALPHHAVGLSGRHGVNRHRQGGNTYIGIGIGGIDTLKSVLAFLLAVVLAGSLLSVKAEASRMETFGDGASWMGNSRVAVRVTTAAPKELGEFLCMFKAYLLGDKYDVDDAERQKYAVRFAVFYAIHHDGREFIDRESGDSSDYGEVHGAIGSGEDYEYTSAAKVEALLLKYFGLENVRHETVITDGYDIRYANNRYYIHIGDGVSNYAVTITAYNDNGNGTYSVRFEIITTWIDGELLDTSNYIAVVQPYDDNGTNAYYLLYWEKGAKKDAPIPLRQPLNPAGAPSPAAGPGPAPAVPQGQSQGSTLTLREDMPLNPYGFKPIIFLTLADAGYKYGLIHIREFSDFIGATAQWDAATATATLTGTDRDGAPLVITLASGQPFITVNGITHDIADYAGASQLHGRYTAYNANGAIYLPFRAVTHAYGGALAWDEATATVTITK